MEDRRINKKNILFNYNDEDSTISHPDYMAPDHFGKVDLKSRTLPEESTVKELNTRIENRKEVVIKLIKKYVNEDMTEEMAIEAISLIISKFEFDLEELKTQILINRI